MSKYLYCDESCHLPNDNSDVMVLGGIECNHDELQRIKAKIRKIKMKYGLGERFELKWTKVSKNLLPMYKELIDLFFEENDLNFRGLIAKGKNELDHNAYNNGDYDEWYYKMYYYLLDGFLEPKEKYRIFIDVKDTNGVPRIKKLHEVLCNNRYDFKKEVIKDIQQVSSERNDLLQLADLFIGSLGYYNRGLNVRENAKLEIVQYIITKSDGKFLGTKRAELKFNTFYWNPRK